MSGTGAGSGTAAVGASSEAVDWAGSEALEDVPRFGLGDWSRVADGGKLKLGVSCTLGETEPGRAENGGDRPWRGWLWWESWTGPAPLYAGLLSTPCFTASVRSLGILAGCQLPRDGQM